MYEIIKDLIFNQKYSEAKTLIEKTTSDYDDTLAILDAEICKNLHDLNGEFSAIQQGLTYNYKNYELYFMLGEYYLSANPYQAFLCYEQAEYYCTEIEDLKIISQAKQALIDDGYFVPHLSIVILSYNCKEEMSLCLNSLKGTLPMDSCEIIVIDNASTDGVTDALKKENDIKLVCNSKNLGFPAGCNQGIKLSEPYNDILLLNNDTVVTPNSIFWLRMGLYENTLIGATGSVSNSASNYQQIEEVFDTPAAYMDFALKNNVPMSHPYEKKLRLIGFSLMIKRSVLDTIGLLDERFSPGNFEDDDLSYRIIQAGYQLLLCKNSFIYHWGSRGFSKDYTAYHRLLETNALKFKKKWGFDAHYYSYERRSLTDAIKESKDASFNILEIGCGMGATLGYLQNKYPNAHVYGIELEQDIVTMAKNYIPSILQGDIEHMLLEYPDKHFDYILFPDVLEHLRNPMAVLKRLYHYLKDDGQILASIPNLMHYTVILDLLKGNFTYSESGILDKTHLRFFTQNEIIKLFLNCNYSITQLSGSYVRANLSAEDTAMYEAILSLPGVASKDHFEVYQYFIEAKKCL